MCINNSKTKEILKECQRGLYLKETSNFLTHRLHDIRFLMPLDLVFIDEGLVFGLDVNRDVSSFYLFVGDVHLGVRTGPLFDRVSPRKLYISAWCVEPNRVIASC